MKAIQKTHLLGMCLVSLSVANAVELYVSPAGSDVNSGSAQAPLASLEGARSVIESQKLAGREPVTVWVKGGTYHQAEPLLLGTKDSGSKKAPITYGLFPAKRWY